MFKFKSSQKLHLWINFHAFTKFYYIDYFISQEIRLYFMPCNQSQNNSPNTLNDSIDKSLVLMLNVQLLGFLDMPNKVTAFYPTSSNISAWKFSHFSLQRMKLHLSLSSISFFFGLVTLGALLDGRSQESLQRERGRRREERGKNPSFILATLLRCWLCGNGEIEAEKEQRKEEISHRK